MEYSTAVNFYQSRIELCLHRLLLIDHDRDKEQIFLDQISTHSQWEDSTILDLPLLARWIVETVVKKCHQITPEAANFLLRLTAILSRKEKQFNLINVNNTFIKIVNLSEVRRDDPTNGIVKNSYIELLTSLLEHRSGIEWMLVCSFWEDILALALNSSNDRATGSRFICKMFRAAVDHDSGDFAERLIDRIVPQMAQNAAATWLLADILQDVLRHDCFTPKVMRLFLQRFDPEKVTSTLISSTVDKSAIQFDMGRIMSIMQVFELFHSARSSSDLCRKSLRCIKDGFHSNLCFDNVQDYDTAMNFAQFGEFFWKLVAGKFECVSKELLTYSDDLMWFSLMPVFCMTFQALGRIWIEIEEFTERDDMRNVYMQKIFKLMDHRVLRDMYKWRDCLFELNVFPLVKASLVFLITAAPFYAKDRAIVIFQSICYAFKDIIVSLQSDADKQRIFVAESECCCRLIQVLGLYLQHFKITWRDSVETIDVMETTFQFLSLPVVWPSNVVVSALNLMKISIVEYMCPNMALLMDNVVDSPFSFMGTYFYAKLHDESTDVRRVTLQVVGSIVHISTNTVDSTITDLPLLGRWIVKTVLKKSHKITPHSANFLLRLTAVLSRKERQFNLINVNNTFIKLVNLSKVKQSDTNCVITNSYIELLTSLLAHKSGIEWMLACNFWEDVLALALNSSNVDRVTSSSFICKMFRAAVDHDTGDFAERLIDRIVPQMAENAAATWLLADILQDVLQNDCFIPKVMCLFIRRFDPQKVTATLIWSTVDKSAIQFDMYRIMSIMQFFELYIGAKKGTANLYQKSIMCMKDGFHSNLCMDNVQDYDTVMKFAQFGEFYWRIVAGKFPCVSEELSSYSKQLMWFTIMSFASVQCQAYGVTPWTRIEAIIDHDDVRYEFMQKIIKTFDRDVLRPLYKWRDYMLQVDMFQFTGTALSYFLRAATSYAREDGIIIFQGFCYVLKDVIMSLQSDSDKLQVFVVESEFCCGLIQALGLYLQHFKITWRDSVETIDVMETTFQFLSLPVVWPSEVIVAALNLMKLSILKYMCPNMALLMDNVADSPFSFMGTFLYAKLHDESRDVRRVTLQVVACIVRISANTDDDSTITDLPLLSRWIVETVIKKSHDITPQSANFLLRLTALLSRKEIQFNLINVNNTFIKLVNLSKVKDDDTNCAIKESYIELLNSLLEHKSGIEWMLVCNFWEDVLALALNSSSDNRLTSSRFICKMFRAAVDHDSGDFAERLIDRIVPQMAEIAAATWLLADILQDVLKHDCFTPKVMCMFLQRFDPEKVTAALIWSTVDKSAIQFDMGRIMYIMQFFELCIGARTRKNCGDWYHKPVMGIKDAFHSNLCIDKVQDYRIVMSFAHFGQFFWRLLARKFEGVSKELESYSNDLVWFSLIPILCTALQAYGNRPWTKIEQITNSDDMRNVFLRKIFKSFDRALMRILYKWRDLIMDHDLFAFSKTALNFLITKAKSFAKDRGIIIFQCIGYVFKDIILSMQSDPHQSEVFVPEIDFCCLLMDVPRHYLEQFKITWRDSVETIDVMETTFQFLSLPVVWPSKVVVAALNLMQISIVKYMCPNMALLMDNVSDSPFSFMGTFFYAKLHDESTDVRRATLQVVTSVVKISTNKFSTILKSLCDSDLPQLVLKMAGKDPESPVRAEAIDCLREMIKTETIYDKYLKKENLTEKILKTMTSEKQGSTRLAAANFLCTAYENNRIAPHLVPDIVDIVHKLSSRDYHRGVRIACLQFWELIIKKLLQNQGMIDGTFPSVTFSKENRKIVTLTDREIKNRVLKVLKELSSNGCLGVLMGAIQGDCDIQVARAGLVTARLLAQLVEKYKINPQNSVLDNVLEEFLLFKPVSCSDSVCDDVTEEDFLRFVPHMEETFTGRSNWLNGIEDLALVLDEINNCVERIGSV